MKLRWLQEKKSVIMLHASRKGRFFPLLVSLMFLIFIYPFLRESSESFNIMIIFFFAVLLAGLYSISHSKKLFTICLFCAVVAYAASLLWHSLGVPLFSLISIFFYGLFFSLIAITTLSSVLSDNEVSSDTINGAICFYLLFAIIWALLYQAIETLQPGSFLYQGKGLAAQSDNMTADLIYYSLVTLTTLGYGDIAPALNHARALSTLEAVVGQLYIAVLIARLVGLHIVYKKK